MSEKITTSNLLILKAFLIVMVDDAPNIIENCVEGQF